MNFYLILGLLVFVYMTFWYFIAIVQKRNDVADIAWGLGFIIVAWVSFYLSGYSFVSFTVNLLVTFWGLRLATHIYSRNKNKPEDSRYAAWRANWKNFYLRSYLQIFLLQGFFLYLISLPVIFINYSVSNLFGITGFLGILIWGIGFYFESTGDRELKEFLSKPENKGHVMDQGLWQYSRHPNYFGEVVEWWGIFVVALSVPLGYLTIVGPLTITFLILFVSGVPLLEKKYEGRVDYEDYKRKTSVFIPLPIRKI
jgi:steroid 5-alpha reductase family enzyme